MREIFFARDKFTLYGEGDFTGTFHMFKGGRELKGDFTAAGRRQRLPLPEPRRLAGLGARSHGGDARHRRTSAAARPTSRYLMAPLGKRDAAGPRVLRRRLPRRRSDGADRLLRDARAAPGRPRLGPQLLEWPLGRYAERVGSGTATFVSTSGASLQGPQLAADAAAAARGAIPGCRGRSASTRRSSRSPVAGDVDLRVRSARRCRFEPSRIFTRRHLRRVRRRHRVRRPIEDAVPRHQPQLAGERSLPGRHHDRVRRADAGDSDRRRRPVRRRDARRVPAAAHRGPLHRSRDARLGRELGRRRRRRRRRELATPTSAAR